MLSLGELYVLQNDLDKFIVDKAFGEDEMDGNDKGFLNDRLLALFTEVGEFANATRCFKYWSIKPPESKERLLDEYIDIFFFWLSIGNTMKFNVNEVEQAYLKKYKENIARQERGNY